MNYLDKTGLTRLWGKITGKLSQKQDTLVSGTNIKTINNQSILGSGNINISGGGGGASIDVQMNGTSIVSNDVANIITESPYNSSTNPLTTKTDLDKKQNKLTTSTWRYVIPGAVYEHAEGFVGNAIVNIYSDAASTYNVQTIISNATSQETLYLNSIEYPLVKHVLGEPGDETYVLSYNVDFSEGDYALGIERVDTTKPCFVVVLGTESESPSGHVLIIVSTEGIRQVPWAFVKETEVEYVAPVAVTGNYDDLLNKPTGAGIVVDHYEELPANVEEYTRAYVAKASLYDTSTLSSYNYDITLMDHVSPVEEPDFTGLTTQQDDFSLVYNDLFGNQFSVILASGANNSWMFLMTKTDSGYVYMNDAMAQGVGFPANTWVFVIGESGVSVEIDFNDVPLVSASTLTPVTTTGNPYVANNFIVDAKKHWAGEYRYIDEEWKYQGVVTTDFLDDSTTTVPSSKLLLDIVNMVLPALSQQQS